jgi:cell division protein FtsZ
MIDFDIPKQQSSIIKVIGIGGGGGNAVNHMFSQKIENVDFISCNTDAQALSSSPVPNKIQLGPHLTQGLGAGAKPEIGKQATEESLDEIKRILEVNTKMAFVCAGMGGGTGTGGAPVVAKICQDLGILTVGIVTTPFQFEGPTRKAQAEQGIKELEPHVDTLLVISNDKLRLQYKNLKIREAFCKADDVLSTAAKCITDVINSSGQINVDFADVCTVMRKGGVAILGNAVAEGDNRAQTAIENAINSPLLNDNNISGAKWILLNITTGEGDYECGTDEFELINSYIQEKTGENTDIIVGMGIDNSLDRELAVTLIATGFAHKNPFLEETKKEIFTLQDNSPETKPESKDDSNFVKEETPSETAKQESPFEKELPSQPLLFETTAPSKIEDGKEFFSLTEDKAEDNQVAMPLNETVSLKEENSQPKPEIKEASLIKPRKIYVSQPQPERKEPNATIVQIQMPALEDKEDSSLKITLKEEVAAEQTVAVANSEEALTDEEIEHKKAEDRIQKLRTLSFNFSGRHDENDDWENVPAYVRRSSEMPNNNLPKENTAETYYSKYTVGKDEYNQTNISSINAFLEGKKPD